MAFFFLMCSERSGSNFITKVLNGHEDVCGPSTKHLFNPVARNFFRYQDLNTEENWKELLSDIENLLQVPFSEWRTHFDKKSLEKLAPRGDLPSLLRNIFQEEAKANGKTHLFIKENQVYEFITFVTQFFPEAKFLYQVRDPRDMALSWKENMDHKGGVVCAAEQWKKDQMQTLKNHEVLKTFDKSFMVTYEDLISDFENKTRQICSFLGIPYSESIRNFHKDELTVKNAEAIPAWSNLSKGVLENNKGKFEEGLTYEEVMMIEKVCYPEMCYLGYQPKFSREEVDDIAENSLSEWKDWELEHYEWAPKEGVRKNMEAKKVFYQKIF